MKRSILLSILLVGSLWAESVQINSGWQLLGAKSTITDMTLFKADGVKNVVAYQNSNFVSFPQEGAIPLLSKIDAGDGFWVNASKSLSLDFPTESSSVTLEKGWKLVGALGSITDMSRFDNSKISLVRAYRDGAWFIYPKQDGEPLLESLSANEGFWVLSVEQNSLDLGTPTLFSQSFSVTNGWNLHGAKHSITDLTVFDTSSINSIWSYKGGAWETYSASSSTNSLSLIDAGHGFWIKGNRVGTILSGSATADLSTHTVKDGWSLLGAKSDFCPAHLFNNSAVKVVWAQDDSGSWKEYSPGVTSASLDLVKKGQGFWVSGSKDANLSALLELNGNIVDGYIKDARIEISSLDTGEVLPVIASRSGESKLNEVNSSSDGAYSFLIPGSASISGYVIKTNGGLDRGSGEIFEGTLQSVVLNPGCGSTSITRHITPVTTIVATAFADSQKSSRSLRAGDEATLLSDIESKIASVLGVDRAFLAGDPVALLKDSTDSNGKTNAARLIKTSLVMQKTAETIAKSITGSSDSEAVEKGVQAAMNALSRSLSGASANSFDTILQDTDTIINKSVEAINEAISADSTLGSKIQNSSDKLSAVKEIIKSTATITLKIDELALKNSTNSSDALKQIEATQKSVEVVTSTIENKLQNVANATGDFSTKITEAKDVLKAVALSGGIEGTKALISSQINRLNVDNKNVDASTFAQNLLNDVTVARQKAQYDKIFGDQIGTDIIGSATGAFKEIIEKKVAGEVVDGVEIAKIIAKNVTNLDATLQATIATSVALVQDTLSTDADTLVTESTTAADNAAITVSEDGTVTETPISSSSISSEESSSSSTNAPPNPFG